jgi:hypothetical protein
VDIQSYHQVHVQLSKRDRKRVTEMLKKGRESARVLRRASILRHDYRCILESRGYEFGSEAREKHLIRIVHSGQNLHLDSE